jgi:hypothetical protein
MSEESCRLGIHFGMQALIMDEQLREVEEGSDGELRMAGPQLSLRYWRDEERPDGRLSMLAARTAPIIDERFVQWGADGQQAAPTAFGPPSGCHG